MSVLPLIMDLADQGVFPYVNGNKVVMTPTARMTDVLRRQVRENKRPLMSGLVELQRLAGSDWDVFEVYPDQLKAFAEMMMISDMRERGIVPNHYTVTVHCQTCNQNVPHFPVDGDMVGACVWCTNGLTAPPIPGHDK